MVLNFMSIQDYGLWNASDDRNIYQLVEELNKRKEHDYTKLLLDTLPRAVLGYDFSIDKVNNVMIL